MAPGWPCCTLLVRVEIVVDAVSLRLCLANYHQVAMLGFGVDVSAVAGANVSDNFFGPGVDGVSVVASANLVISVRRVGGSDCNVSSHSVSPFVCLGVCLVAIAL